MSTVRYSVHYEDYSEHLSSRFGKLLQMQLFVDTTLMCSSHTLRVHKAVLAASSPYFQDILEKQTGEPLIIMKMRFGVLKSLVEFMYCGRTNCMEDNLEELVAAAQFLKIKGLSKVSKEGLGGKSWGDLPEFSPPIVINQPVNNNIKKNGMQMPHEASELDAPFLSTNVDEQSLHEIGKELVVRIPIDMQVGAGAVQPVEAPPYYSRGGASRGGRARRGRPRIKHRQTPQHSWGRQPGRAQQKRDHFSQKAIQELQNIHLRDYMDRVTLTQAVDSICGPGASSYSSDIVTLNNDIAYDNPGPSPLHCSQVPRDTLQPNEPDTNRGAGNGISSTMSQYVNVLKNAGLPTDLPILFESGDGSYINVNEQVLLDMVQSNEIQYEVIEQPDIVQHIEHGQIKSIDDLTRSLAKSELSTVDSAPDPNIYFNTKEKNLIIPNHLETYGDRQQLDDENEINHLDQRLTESPLPLQHSLEYNSIDCEMSYFTSRAMKDDIRKYYEEQRLSDTNSITDLCPATTADNQNLHMPNIEDGDHTLSTIEKDTNNFTGSFNFGILAGNSSNDIDPSLDYLIMNQKNSLFTPTECDKVNGNDIGKSFLNLDTNVIHDTESVIDKEVSCNFLPPLQLNDVKDSHINQESIIEEVSEKVIDDTPLEVVDDAPETSSFKAKPVTIAFLMKQDGSTFKEYRQIKKISIMPAKSVLKNVSKNVVTNMNTENYVKALENSFIEEKLGSKTPNEKYVADVSDDRKLTSDEKSSNVLTVSCAKDTVLPDGDSQQKIEEVSSDIKTKMEKLDAEGLLPCNKTATKMEEEQHSPRVTRARSMHLKHAPVEAKRISSPDDSSSHKTKRLRNKENVDPTITE